MPLFVKQEIIDGYTSRIDELEDTVRGLEGRLAEDIVVSGLAMQVREHLDIHRESTGTEEQAHMHAVVAVVADESERITDKMASDIIAREGPEFAAVFREKEEPDIRRRVREGLERDGILKRERQDAEDKVVRELTIDEAHRLQAQIREEEGSDERRAEHMERIRPQVAASPEMADYRGRVRRSNERVWTGQVEEVRRAEIDEEECRREPGFKSEYEAEYRESDRAQRIRDQIRRQKEMEWEDATEEKVNEAMPHEVTTELLAKKHARIQEQLRRENRAAELLEDFVGSGVDMTKIESGSSVILYFGSAQTEEVEVGRENEFGSIRTRIEKQKVMRYHRKLMLVSRGNGRFLVKSDSLNDEKSVYMRKVGIRKNTVIVPGTNIKDGDEHRFEPIIGDDMPFSYDTDLSTPEEFYDTEDGVANLVVDGVYAVEVNKSIKV